MNKKSFTKWLVSVRVVAIAAIIGFSMASCSNSSENLQENDNGKISSSSSSSEGGLNTNEQDKIYGEFLDEREKYDKEMDTFVGYGINLFNGPTFADAVIYPLLSRNIYDGNKYISKVSFNQAESFTFVSDKLSDVYSSLNIDAKIGTGKSVPFFSANVSAHYGNSKQVKSQTKFYKYIYSSVMDKHTLNPLSYAAPETRSQIFDPIVFNLINDNNTAPQTLFEYIGTHVITSCGIGGSATISALYDSDEFAEDTDIKAALDFSSAWVSGEAKTGLIGKQKIVHDQSTITVNYRGGTTTIVGTIPEAIAPQLKTWAESIKDAPTLGYIYTVLPIWELASNQTRADEIKKAFEGRAADINHSLLGYFSKNEVPKEPFIVDNAKYYILNWHSQKSIDVGGQKNNSGAQVHLWDKLNNITSQRWQAIESWEYPGYFAFKNVNSGMYLDVDDGNVNSFLKQYISNGTNAQLFKVVGNGDGSVFIHSKLNEMYKVSTDTDNHGNGTFIYLKTDSQSRTKWKLERVN
jgi:hypothetical protein